MYAMPLYMDNQYLSPMYFYNKMEEFQEDGQQQTLEFDGTTVLCRVCGDKASGFHYGVHSCEGCKGFFRRSIQQKIQYRPCSKNQQCSILRVNRNRCQYCRLKKCITVGMSRDAVRFGRVPKREKAKILAAMQASYTIKNTESMLNEELMNTTELKATIVNAHLKTCEFTRGKLEQLVKSALVETKDSGNSDLKTDGGIASATLSYLTCPLNPKNFASTEDNCDDNFSDRFSPAIRGVVEFAKLLPGFNVLTQDDQIILLKSGVFEVLLLRLSNMFLNGKMICINGKVVNVNNIDEEGSGSGQSTSSAKFLIKSMFKFTNEFNQWNLNDNIIGIFSSIVIMSWDRPGLQNPDLIKKIQSFYRHVLQTLLPLDLCNTLESMIPDLRALNTLHSAKLLSFKMEDRKKFEEEDADMSMDTDELPSLSHPNQPGIQQCPFNSTNSMLTHFPVSPSDSGIESGAGSSPSRSETNEPPMYNAEESMPVLMKALLAPPIIDNQYISTNLNYYDRSSEGSTKRMGSQDPEYNVIGHKKFRRTTLTPPTDMTRTPSPTPIQYGNFGGMVNQTKPEAVNDFSKNQEKSPVQLYPQLASALTRPICTTVASASVVPPPSPPAPEMTTLKQSLLRPPMTCNAETSDYIHSLIMRNDGNAPKPMVSNKRPIACLYETNPSPLNLCMKSAPLSVNQMT